MRSTKGLHIVALFEAAKGVIVLVTGFGLFLLVHKDLHAFAQQVVSELHLNPAKHYPDIFIDAISRVNDAQLWVLAVSALIYSAARLAEAYGLWFQQQWAKWFGFLTGGMYVPIEVYENMRRATWPRLTVLLVNLFVVAYLGIALYRSERRS